MTTAPAELKEDLTDKWNRNWADHWNNHNANLELLALPKWRRWRPRTEFSFA